MQSPDLPSSSCVLTLARDWDYADTSPIFLQFFEKKWVTGFAKSSISIFQPQVTYFEHCEAVCTSLPGWIWWAGQHHHCLLELRRQRVPGQAHSDWWALTGPSLKAHCPAIIHFPSQHQYATWSLACRTSLPSFSCKPPHLFVKTCLHTQNQQSSNSIGKCLSPVMTMFLNVGANVNHYQEGEAPYNTPASLPEKRLQCDSTYSMGKV